MTSNANELIGLEGVRFFVRRARPPKQSARPPYIAATNDRVQLTPRMAHSA